MSPTTQRKEGGGSKSTGPASVFISYSRSDDAFAGRLQAALEQRQIKVYRDRQDIERGEAWWTRIQQLITAADSIVFVLSPDSLASEVALREVDFAATLNKRFLPVVARAFPGQQAPEALAQLNYIFFVADERAGASGDFDEACAQLVRALGTDIGWVRAHTRFLVRAREWEREGHNDSFLLRGMDLQNAYGWLGQADLGTDPPPTPLQREYVRASAEHEAREIERLRELYSRALARQLAAQAELSRVQHADLIERSLLLAIESMRRSPSTEAESPLRKAVALLPRSVLLPARSDSIKRLAFSPDGRFVVAEGRQGVVQAWEVATTREAFGGNVSDLSALAFSSDRRYVAAAYGQTVVLRETDSSAEVWRATHSDELARLVFSSDTRFVATATRAGTVHVWETMTGAEVARAERGAPVFCVAFDPNGRCYVATVSGNVADIYEVTGSAAVAQISHKGYVDQVVIGREGGWLATRSGDWAHVLDLTTGEGAASLCHPEQHWTQNRALRDIALSPDGRFLATASLDRTARLWDLRALAAGARTVLPALDSIALSHDGYANCVAFSEIGDVVATGSEDYSARIWDMSGRQLGRMDHDGPVSAITFSPDGRHLATESDSLARVWTVRGGVEVARALYPGLVGALTFSPDGRSLAAACEGGCRVWAIANGEPVADMVHSNRLGAVAFTPDGKHLATACRDWKARIWEWGADGSRVVAVMSHFGEVTDVQVSPTGRHIATANPYECKAIVWDADSLILPPEHQGDEPLTREPMGTAVAFMIRHEANRVAFSRDGMLLASACQDHKVYVQRLSPGSEEEVDDPRTLQHDGPVTGSAFSPDGSRLATASEDGAVRVWDLATASEVVRFSRSAKFLAVAFAPDGTQIAAALNDGTARVWALAGGAEVLCVRHDGPVRDVAFSLDGRCLATGSEDKTARIWQVATGHQIAHMTHDREVVAIAFSPDGMRLATACFDGVARIWLVSREDPIAEGCRRLTRNLTEEEWARFLSDEPYQKTCPTLAPSSSATTNSVR